MAFTFAGKVVETMSLRHLAEVANHISRWRKRSRYKKVMERVDVIIDQDITGVIEFVRVCQNMDLIHTVVQAYVVKFGAHSFDVLMTLISLINVIRSRSEDEANALIDMLFSKTPEVFSIPNDANDENLVYLIQQLSRVTQAMNSFSLIRENSIRAITVFAGKIIAKMVQRIVDGYSAHEFFENMNVINFQAILISAVAQVKDVSASVLKQFLAIDIIANPEFKMKEPGFSGDIHLFIKSLIAALRREMSVLSLDELRIVAQNVIDIEGDGTCIADVEDYIIAFAPPFFKTEEDVIALCKAFYTKTGKHRLIIAFLSVCTELTNYQLRMLAECVMTSDFRGEEAKTQLRIAKEKFNLTADIEEVFKFAKKSMNLGHIMTEIIFEKMLEECCAEKIEE